MNALVVSGALVVVVGAGWYLQRSYLEHRYADTGLPLEKVDAVFRDLRAENVATFGLFENYPIFGTDLSNRVWQPSGPTRGSPVLLCRRWRQILTAGDYSYVVLAQQPYGRPRPAEEWIASDPAITPVLRMSDAAVFRVNGPLSRDTCSSSGAEASPPRASGEQQAHEDARNTKMVLDRPTRPKGRSGTAFDRLI